jgi:putative ABC transport system permease protein
MAEGQPIMLRNGARELRFAARALARHPAYAAVAAVTLSLGIGATVAIFSLVNAVLLRPLPYPDADRIVTIRHHAPGINLPELHNSPGMLDLYRESSRSLTPIAGYEGRSHNLTGSGLPERVLAVAVTPEFFGALAVRPALGRIFEERDAQENSPPVGILTHGLWQSRFGADPNVVGTRVQLDGRSMEVVGVMPRDFMFPNAETRLLVPLWLDPRRGFGTFGTRTVARLAPAVSLEEARAEITALQRRIPIRFPDVTQDSLDRFGWAVTLEPLRDSIVNDIAAPLWILFGSVAIVLLIAGANVANLFLVRAESRQRELAVRAALGGSRMRIASGFLAESVLLAAMGGLVGAVLAAFGVRLLVAYGPAQLPRLHEISVDASSIGFAIVVSLVVGLALGLVTVPGLTHRSFAQALRDGGRATTAGRQRHRVRHLLIAGQVAMAVVLLVGSGLMLRSIARLSAVDPGFRVDGVLTAGVSLGRDADRARITVFSQRVLEEIAGLPGVTSVGVSNSLPIEATMNGSSFAIESRPRAEDAIPPVTMYQVVTDGYFETLGLAIRAGRAPTNADAMPGRSVAWVNETFARRYLDNRAVGERIRLEKYWLDIVGVVSDARTFGLREEIQPVAYLPLGTPVTTVGLDVLHLVIGTAATAASVAPGLRPALDRVDASVPLIRIRTMEDIVSSSLAETAFTMVLLVIAASVALILGVVGLYGVISYVVKQRTAEIGIRLAIGAQPDHVRRLVLRQGLSVALVGVAIGLVAAALVSRFMRSLVFEISTRDPITFAGVALVLTAVSALATYLPARRAASIDPLQALREEG